MAKRIVPRPKAWWFVVSFFSGFLLAMWAEELRIHPRNDELHVSAPRLHFLTGRSLERLQNGAAVPFDFQLSVSLDSRTNLFDRAVERYAISYDLWEEKYSVARLSGANSLRGISRRYRERTSASHLTAEGVETWCIDDIAVSTAGIDPNRVIWVRLEIRAADSARDNINVLGESGVSLTRLIELFSHPPRTGQQRWTLEAGPVRLAEILRPGTRGT